MVVDWIDMHKEQVDHILGLFDCPFVEKAINLMSLSPTKTIENYHLICTNMYGTFHKKTLIVLSMSCWIVVESPFQAKFNWFNESENHDPRIRLRCGARELDYSRRIILAACFYVLFFSVATARKEIRSTIVWRFSYSLVTQTIWVSLSGDVESEANEKGSPKHVARLTTVHTAAASSRQQII